MPTRAVSRSFRIVTTLLALAWSAVASAAPDVADATTDSPSFIGEMVSIVLPLAFIIVGLLVVLRLLRRRYGLTGQNASLSVLQIVPIGPRERVVLLRSKANRVFVVGVSAQSVNFITDLDPEDVVLPPEAAANRPTST